jgi:hypothetical protein
MLQLTRSNSSSTNHLKNIKEETYMKIISIDVGIKNLAYCILEVDKDAHCFRISQWDVISFLDKTQTCSECTCRFNASLVSPQEQYWCKRHAKKQNLIMPPSITKLDALRNQCSKLNIKHIDSMKKADLRKQLQRLCCKPLKKISSHNLSLIDIGFAMKDVMAEEFKEHTFDAVIIEQQMTARMKCIQSMLAQYFIMTGVPHVEFIHAYRKLSRFHPNLLVPKTKKKKAGYKERKEAAIQNVRTLLHPHKTLYSIFQSHKKKDDMADSLLQGMYYASTIDESCILNIIDGQ